ncbi:hypothetical protein SASPL_142166 [Salvia splendens]|uniref:Uncharacterized protein n=1 Tax=Salvia splendens TaxID=180675 RepID=A0A8X8Z962_SALSN|nr:hypothetical protein SASPL_142166 [Salvia splendens]
MAAGGLPLPPPLNGDCLPPEFDEVHGFGLPFQCRDFLTFTLVGDGIFHVKRYDVHTGVPPRSDDKDIVKEDADDNPTAPKGRSSDEYQPSETETDSSDGSEYVDDHGALDVDGCPTFVVTITTSHLDRTLKVPFGF